MCIHFIYIHVGATREPTSSDKLNANYAPRKNHGKDNREPIVNEIWTDARDTFTIKKNSRFMCLLLPGTIKM